MTSCSISNEQKYEQKKKKNARKKILYIYFMIQSRLIKQTVEDKQRVEFDTRFKVFCYLASWNFLSLLGRSWFLRCLNHLWTCRTEQPACLLKLSVELWRQKQDKDRRVSTVSSISGVITWQQMTGLTRFGCKDGRYISTILILFRPQTSTFLNSMIGLPWCH